jgi:hypothetical protein
VRRLTVIGCAVVAVALLAGSADADAARPLRTGVFDPVAFAGPRADQSFARARIAGASVVRLPLFWALVAPAEPADPLDPDDPGYHWQATDRQVLGAARAGLEPLLFASGAAPWARGGAVGLRGTWPSPSRYAEFARAAARRYSGSFTPAGSTAPLPRVRFWQAWNEPNTGREISPQRVNGRAATPAHYRQMLNAFADAVHDVSRGNRVVGGTLSPFGHNSKDIQVVAPLRFMSDLLCVSMTPPHRKTCSQRVSVDVWAQNAYTNGGPNHRAHSPADVSIGDLPEMRALLVAAKRRGTVISTGVPDFWVTEISWDTSPPDPKGVPPALHARWVSEGLYRMWLAGVSTVIWWRLQDDPLRESPYQSGFFTAGGKQKASITAFRFPFVAFRTGDDVLVWGRTPTGRRGSVVVERKAGSRWQTVARLPADQYGIFSRRLSIPVSATTAYRARIGSATERSIPFSLSVPPGRRTTPFGCGGPIPC